MSYRVLVQKRALVCIFQPILPLIRAISPHQSGILDVFISVIRPYIYKRTVPLQQADNTSFSHFYTRYQVGIGYVENISQSLCNILQWLITNKIFLHFNQIHNSPVKRRTVINSSLAKCRPDFIILYHKWKFCYAAFLVPLPRLHCRVFSPIAFSFLFHRYHKINFSWYVFPHSRCNHAYVYANQFVKIS